MQNRNCPSPVPPRRNRRSGIARFVQSESPVLLSLFLFFTGCGGPERAAPVDVELAKSTLAQVLDHWKNGGTIAELRQQNPEIVVQEALWSGETRLQEFTLTDSSRAENANWFCDVELILVPKSGGPTKTRTVTYAVGTDPVLTVFHAML